MIRSSTHSQQQNDTPHHGSPLFTRRNLLLLVGGGFAALGTLQWLRLSATPELTTSHVTTQISDVQHNQFLTLSKLLTSNQHLHGQTSARIYAALDAQNPDFQQQAGALFQFVQTHQLTNVDTILNSLTAELAPLKPVLHQIIEAWYLGVVNVGTHRKVVAYAAALMFDPVRDVIGVPSYCHAAPGYWAAQPLKVKG
jgi:hypothetical protein